MREDLLRKVKEALEEIEPSAEIYLYGSRARRDNREDSDWDFLILIDGIVDTARTVRIASAIGYMKSNGRQAKFLVPLSETARSGMVQNMRRFLCWKMLSVKECLYERQHQRSHPVSPLKGGRDIGGIGS